MPKNSLFLQEFLAVAYDSVQVINRAVDIDPCLTINGSDISPDDTDAMLTCLRKVKRSYLIQLLYLRCNYVVISVVLELDDYRSLCQW